MERILENNNKDKVEVGEIAEDGLRLWCARLSLNQAKEESQRLDDAVQKIKTRASNLIAWAVALLTVLTSVFYTHPNFQAPIAVMLCLYFMVGFLCVLILKAIPWKYTYFFPEYIADLQLEYHSELEIIEIMAITYNKHNKENSKQYYKIQNMLKWALNLFVISPLGGFILTYFLLGSCG